MLKPAVPAAGCLRVPQPPSGGCVLKQTDADEVLPQTCPAAFGRLCVETLLNELPQEGGLPAAFGRLCVETGCALKFNAMMMFPAAFGRLCVETTNT